MKKMILITVGVITVSVASYAQDTWVVDRSHSSVQFNIDHLIISEVSGSFSDFEGTLIMKGDDFSTAQFTGGVQVKSIETGNDQRDGHLLSPDFFDASEHPLISFKSTKVKLKEDKYLVSGILSMKGINKEIEMEVDYKGTVKFMGQMKSALKLTTSINRFDFGLNWNAMLEAGGAVVGKDVEIALNLELVKQ